MIDVLLILNYGVISFLTVLAYSWTIFPFSRVCTNVCSFNFYVFSVQQPWQLLDERKGRSKENQSAHSGGFVP